ncbi:MAG TPA: sulfate adenylyltransferase subunit CysN [Polyangiaceae bacterium]
MDVMDVMDDQALIENDILGYLEQHQKKELCRFTTVGSVDDGKSTLIGRLLYDAHGLYEDQLRAVERASSTKSEMLDLSLVTDGLKAEREQGITIDVAYRYFSTQKRKFIIADTPGHVQYTRNMATGASTANVAVILIDARLGVLQQSRRHAYIASLLGIPHLAVCVNKMDLRGYDQATYDAIVATFTEFAKRLTFKEVTFIPISALKGDNIVHPSETMPWYAGPTLLHHLETVPVANDQNYEDFRYPVQYVLRPHLDYRGFSGQIASGVVEKGDPVMVLPSRKTTRVKAIDTFEGERDRAFAPMSVTLRLEDEVDISRGDMLVRVNDLPHVGQRFEAMIVWMSERPLDLEKSYFLKHTTHTIRAEIEAVLGQTDLETLTEKPAQGLSLNDIGRARVRCHRPIFFDPYSKNRGTGAFILVDSTSNNTVAAGMIVAAEEPKSLRSAEPSAVARSQVSPTERRERLGQTGGVVWIGSATPVAALEVAYALERRLFDLGRVAFVVDVSSSGQGNALEVARRVAPAGLLLIVAGGALSGAERDSLLSELPPLGLTEVRVDGGSAGTGPTSKSAVAVSLEHEDSEHIADTLVGLLRTNGIFH